ncbi:uncharacterized protein [Nicotiana sylvestris]|uniref:uncharacterized protein n=1 Tax=Nicotiana sylvestris TaxID=4096 RepID=UPI00388CE8B3
MSPQGSPRRSREGTPEGFHTYGQAQFENVEAMVEALQKLITAQAEVEPPVNRKMENQGPADADGVLTPHNDALVISLIVHDTNVKLVLIDPGSSVNIILLRVLCETQAEVKVIPKVHTLSGFDNSSVLTKEEVTLTTFAEGVVKGTKSQVADMKMAYNMILGRLWIHKMDVVPSTLHQVIKFPSPWGICQIHGDQHTTRAINYVADTSTRNEGK